MRGNRDVDGGALVNSAEASLDFGPDRHQSEVQGQRRGHFDFRHGLIPTLSSDSAKEQFMSQIQNSLKQAGVVLPTPAAPVANYVGTVITGNLLVISGQLCLGADGKLDAAHRGKLGDNVSLEAGQAAARLCAINLLAQASVALGGNLDRIRRCVRLGGFINTNPTYAQIPQVMNGASDLIVQILGDSGRHARSTVGVAQLPLDCAVEVEAMFEIAQD